MSRQAPVHGNLSHSMRSNYNEHGVDEYYRKVNASYRNPFFPGIRKVIFTFLEQWYREEHGNIPSRGEALELSILDLAAGSGEATICIQDWHNDRFHPPAPFSNPNSTSPTASPPPMNLPNPLAALQAQAGPSRVAINVRPAFIPPNRRVAMQADGSRSGANQSRDKKKSAGSEGVGGAKEGKKPPRLKIIATDPYTVAAYETRTNQKCFPLSFNDIANGDLQTLSTPPPTPTTNPAPARPIRFDLIICSFALHLVGDAGELFALLNELARCCRWLCILAPHKKPEIKEGWGWIRWDIQHWKEMDIYATNTSDDTEDDGDVSGRAGKHGEIVIDKVRCRLYKSVGYEKV